MRTVSANIETESAKSRLRVVDLLKVKFPSAVGWKYWANVPWTYDSNTYEARIVSLGSWVRSMEPESNSLTIELANADGAITEIYNAVETELAEVEHIRLFPDISPSGEDLTLWSGWGGTMVIGEDIAEWEIYFGLRGFTHKGLRKISLNCWKIFKDGVWCPYDGTSIGDCGTLNEDVDLTETDIDVLQATLYAVNDVVLVDSEEMLITGIAGATLTVTRGYNGTTQATHTNGTNVFHHNCYKDKASCNRRRMYGPPDNGTGKRYFGGWTEIAPVPFSGGGVRKGWRGKKIPVYSQRSYGNDSLYGSTIPAVYGHCRLRDIAAAGSADAMEFRHALFIICEGPISAIATNLVRVDGLPPDDIPNPNGDGFDTKSEDSLLVWWGANDQRQSDGLFSGNSVDSYLSNPYLFNAADGDGPSLSGLAAVRVRTEEGGEEFTDTLPILDVQIIGRTVRTVAEWVADDPGTEITPNPIEVALDYLLNGKFGARLDKDQINLTVAQTESDYCDALVDSVDPGQTVITGDVLGGPDDPEVTNTPRDNWIACTLSADVGDLAGHYIEITGARAQTKLITRSGWTETMNPGSNSVAGALGFIDDTDFGETGGFYIIEIEGSWTAGTPIDGDAFNILTRAQSSSQNKRFMFDGALVDDDNVERHLEMILQNCNGYYFPRGKEIIFGIRKAVTLATIDTYAHIKDHGSDRNVLRENGVSTLRVQRVAMADGLPNQIDVIYNDSEHDFLETVIHVYDEDLQTLFGEIVSGNATRVVSAKSLKLIGTSTKDQAMRLGALALREAAMQRDVITFSMSLKDSLALEPGDVRKVDSVEIDNDPNKQISKRIEYMRIKRIEETDKFTAMVEGYRHENGAYDDTFVNLISLGQHTGVENPANFPMDVTPVSPTEAIEYGDDGTVLSIVNVEVTYP